MELREAQEKVEEFDRARDWEDNWNVNYPHLTHIVREEGACGSAPRLAVEEVVSTPSTCGWLTSGG